MPELKKMIKEKFPTEAACARALEWDRRKLNKLTTGKKEPDIRELFDLSNVLDVPITELVIIFLRS